MAAQAAQDGRTSPSLQEPKPAHAGGPRSFLFVEDAAAVHLRAKALAARRASPVPAAAAPPPAAVPDAAPPPAAPPAVEQPAAAQRLPSPAPATDWSSDAEEDGRSNEEAEEGQWLDEQEEAEARAAAAWRPDPGSVWAATDPTVRLALALKMDPRRLPALGGPAARGSTPAAAIKALRFALQHPAAAPSQMAGPASPTGHHLQLTASCLAKQRRKAGATAAGGGGGKARVQTIDALLGAMRRRLQAVQEAMAADMAAAAVEEARQRQIEAAQAAVEAQAGTSAGSSGTAPASAAPADAPSDKADQREDAAAAEAGGHSSPRARPPKRETLDILMRQHADVLREQQHD